MPIRSSRQALQRLHALAHDQGGYFTAKQAAKLGYAYPHLTYHATTGNIERAGHGLYRIRSIPLTDHDDLVRFSFWSRNRDDAPQAVISHVTALAVHGLTDMLPHDIHATVPRPFQKKPPRGWKLHRGDLTKKEVEARDGFRVTTALRALVDVASSPAFSPDSLAFAIRAALERGLVDREALEGSARTDRARRRIVRALEALPRAS